MTTHSEGDCAPAEGDRLEDDLLDLYERMLGDVDIRDVLRQVTEVVRERLAAEAATIYLVVEETRELESVAVVGNVSRLIRVPIRDESLAGFCAVHRRAFVVGDAYGDLSPVSPDLRFDRSWDAETGFRTHDVMCAPAVFGDTVYGVVQVINRIGRPFDEGDLPDLVRVSRLVSYALYHTKMYDELATLKTLDKQKAEFMRVMVHELKSPVSGSKMLASSLVFVHKDEPKVVGAASRIAERMDALLELIEDIIRLSRVKSGAPLGDVEVFDIVPETRAICEPYMEQARAADLGSSMHLVEHPVRVRFDRQGYRLVVSNLVSNAVKYTPSGSVSVMLLAMDGEAVFSVTDTGLGIPEKDVPKLFQEFYRASNVRGGDIRGTGVGLAGVRQLVERFGGSIELETRENEGTTFTVRLPLA